MRSEEILLQQLPEELRGLVERQDVEKIIGYFFEYDIEERRIADALSRYAITAEEANLHLVAAEVYSLCLPYLDDAFELAFFHEWRALELTDFSDRKMMENFLENKEHPDFDIIPASYYHYIEDKIK
ncbi:hypothetical protein ERX27_05275 [Macrococcus brunensis]|uniref:Uncharacterized protein n=1 Tax=Macrococcus brunensis TaxID=198483 RepID=A0A4R6BEA7_9STAP|nr:hypothetical protein [Macrococcus brunensis]TDL98089.1 hypothetical protein ERX27_05275 [Macrococcus brunensis]